MLRGYFVRNRELLGRLCQLAFHTVQQMMQEVVSDEHRIQPGMVVVIQTFGSRLNLNPHVHAIVSRGGWLPDGSFRRISYLDTHAAELIFRHEVLVLLRDEGLIDDDRTRLLLSWRHSGFSVHNAVGVDHADRAGLERLARYFLRSPVSLQRLSWDESTDEARYALKATPASQPHDAAEPDTAAEETLSGLELLARIITHIPEPRHHLARYYGAYSSVSRARRRRDVPADSTSDPDSDTAPHTPADSTAPRRNRLWADLIRRIYELDPLLCPHCGGEMSVIAFITDPPVVRRILGHLDHGPRDRSPPQPSQAP